VIQVKSHMNRTVGKNKTTERLKKTKEQGG